MGRCYTHRETSSKDTPNAIDSWTDKFSVPCLKSYQKKKKKLTEQRLTVVEIRNGYSQNLTD